MLRPEPRWTTFLFPKISVFNVYISHALILATFTCLIILPNRRLTKKIAHFPKSYPWDCWSVFDLVRQITLFQDATKTPHQTVASNYLGLAKVTPGILPNRHYQTRAASPKAHHSFSATRRLRARMRTISSSSLAARKSFVSHQRPRVCYVRQFAERTFARRKSKDNTHPHVLLLGYQFHQTDSLPPIDTPSQKRKHIAILLLGVMVRSYYTLQTSCKASPPIPVKTDTAEIECDSVAVRLKDAKNSERLFW